jgi:hypothetical protein
LSKFTILLLLFTVRIFLGPVTFVLDAGASKAHIVEAFNQIKLKKRRASFIDLQRSSTPLSNILGVSIHAREAASRIPVRSERRTIAPPAYDTAKPLVALLPRLLSPSRSRKEILLI